MVFLKVTDGIEARRFQVTPGQITFQQLQEKVASFFPGVTEEASILTLRYRDSDGDVITLSSDEEFQEVLSDLPNEHVWKLHIHTPSKKREERRPCQGVSLLDHLLDPFAVRRNPWSEFDRQFKETQELVELLFGIHNPKPSTSEDTTKPSTSEDTTKPSTSEDTTKPSTSEDTTESENQGENADGGTTEGTKASEASPKEGEDEEVKSKLSGGAKKVGSECPAGPHCHVKRVHLWEPTLFGGLFGPRRVFSPSVAYHITLTPKATAASSA
jgi:hypothetical protein